MKTKQLLEELEDITEQDEAACSLLRGRTFLAVGVIVLFFSIIVMRFWYLQVIQGEEYRQLAETNRVRIQSIAAPRGHIVDRFSREIVTNRPSFNVALIREDSIDLEDVIKRLAPVLDEEIEVLWERIRAGSADPPHLPITLKEDIDWQTLAYLENNKYKFSGIRIEVQPVRTYHYDDLAANTIGYIGSISRKELQADGEQRYEGSDLVGKRGLEKLFEPYLRGEKGSRSTEVNARGFEQQQLQVVNPLPGNDIRLTLDAELQKVAEQFMAIGDKAGAVVVLEVKTGKVLAAVSTPPIHLEHFIGGISHKNWQALLDNPRHPLINKVVQASYPPGSTYKVVTALAGLDTQVIDTNTEFYCPGYHRFGNRVYRCWKRGGHGMVNLKQAIAQSCDVYFYQVGQRVGVDRLAHYARILGLGEKTGVQMEHEKSGLVPTQDWKKQVKNEKWHEGETLSIAIGQGFNLVTPLQLCVMTATVANGGRHFRPQIIESIVTPDGRVVKSFSPELVNELSPREQAYVDIIKEGLLEVVHGKRGTARGVRIEGLKIAGKTGTAQVVRIARYKGLADEDIPYHLRDHAWFTCYAPADDPEIAVTVLVEHGLHGSSGAGPIARYVLKKYFSHRLQAEGDNPEKSLSLVSE
jgi:penicillin-binding protein 2